MKHEVSGFYKYLGYFGLWVNLLACAGEALLLFSGKTFGSLIYQWHPNLRMIECIFGFGWAILAFVSMMSAISLCSNTEGAEQTAHSVCFFSAIQSVLASLVLSWVSGRRFRVIFIGSFAVLILIVNVIYWLIGNGSSAKPE